MARGRLNRLKRLLALQQHVLKSEQSRIGSLKKRWDSLEAAQTNFIMSLNSKNDQACRLDRLLAAGVSRRAGEMAILEDTLRAAEQQLAREYMKQRCIREKLQAAQRKQGIRRARTALHEVCERQAAGKPLASPASHNGLEIT